MPGPIVPVIIILKISKIAGEFSGSLLVGLHDQVRHQSVIVY